jgi:hypothetical protein
VGKKAKHKEAPKRPAKEPVDLRAEDASPPAELAVRVFERIQAEASGRFDRIVSESQHEAEALSVALTGMLVEAQVVAHQGIDAITSDIRDVRTRCAELREAAERDRAAVHAVLVAARAAANNLEAQARRHAEEIASRGNASLAQFEQTLTEARVGATTRARAEIDRAVLEVTTGLDAAQRAIDEQLQQFRDLVAREVVGVAADGTTVDVDPEPSEATADDPIWRDLADATCTSDGDLQDDENFFSRLAAELRADEHDRVVEAEGRRSQ